MVNFEKLSYKIMKVKEMFIVCLKQMTYFKIVSKHETTTWLIIDSFFRKYNWG